MQTKQSHSETENHVTENDLVLIEMHSFLKALASYPECFAANPQMTFEQHRTSLVPVTNPARVAVQASA
ncbi:MAG TPA: hypothetical protein VGS27_28750 [Candidatus Sulfotelmatobacter sp.]|nr:hypothetical protein [Candidatus Sulfotelmatobacter sp.]